MMPPANDAPAVDRVRYMELIAPVPGGWTVRFRCCGRIALKSHRQIQRVRLGFADQCNDCRISGLRAKPIKTRGCAPC